MVILNPCIPVDLFRTIRVMRHSMMPFGDAHLRVGAVADLAGHHEREHASDVGLIRERQQVEHHVDMIFINEWNAGWRFR